MVNDKIQQLDVDWIPGNMQTLCVLSRNPEELTRDLGIRFNRSYDNLDYLKYAVIETTLGRIFGLVRHENNPRRGTELCVGLGYGRRECKLDEALSTIRETRDNLTWIADNQ